MPERSISSAIRDAFTVALFLSVALFPTTASACVAITAQAPIMTFWDQPPKAGQGEVVLKVRLLRKNPAVQEAGDGRCYPGPAVYVFEVADIAEGAFQPTQVFLFGSGAPLNPEQTGWLVGKPATLYMKHITGPSDGEPPIELPSIEWRTPPCTKGFVCPPPNLRVLQP